MGYNGGTNKQGYYRRYHGMYSKSSYRSGEKILSNFIFGSLGLLAATGKAVVDMANDAPTPTDVDRKHFSPKDNKLKSIICGIFILLCPIMGFITFEFYDWWIFCSVLLFGVIELIPSLLSGGIDQDMHVFGYFYQDEAEPFIPQCKQNIKITLGFFIAAFILNLYPIVYLILDFTIGGFYEWEGGEGITMWLIAIKLLINGYLIYATCQSYKSIEGFILNHGRKRISLKDSSNGTKSLYHTLRTSSRAVEVIKDYRIQRTIKRDWRNEIMFYFYSDLMDEATFDKQNFGINFQKNWFTYTDYVNKWKETHWELRFCTKVHEITEDITKTEIITLQDFKDPSTFKDCIDNILMQRLDPEEKQAYRKIKNNNSDLWGLIIFNYKKCRDLKLDSNNGSSVLKHTLEWDFRESLSKALNLSTIYDRNFTEIVLLIEQVENSEILLEKPKAPAAIEANNIKDNLNIEANCVKDVEETIPEAPQCTTKYSEFKNQPENTNKTSEIKLPKISGEYVESFGAPHGKLHIGATRADIQFYFPGPDLRYNGTFFNIPESEIDNYIQAYKDNWIKAQELYEKAQTLPDTTLRIVGEKGMNIIVSNRSIDIYLHQHHLPVRTEEQCSNMINRLQIAKLRIKEIQQKLFE